MIKYCEINNFFSIGDEQIVDFSLNNRKDFAANPVIGFAGSNASGKTNVLRAFAFLRFFISESFLGLKPDSNIPSEPFFTQPGKDTSFFVIFAIDGRDYGYKLEFFGAAVSLEELSLYEDDNTGQMQPIFVRKKNEIDRGSLVTPIPIQDLRDNSSYISYAKQFNSQELIKKIATYFENFSVNILMHGIKPIGYSWQSTLKLLEFEERRTQALKILKYADVAIQDIKVIKHTQKELESMELEAYTEAFYHNIDGRILPFLGAERMSAGTLQMLAVLPSILYALEKGTVVIWDEIEIKLHQNLVAYLIGLFQNPSQNPKQGQLIFSFHNTVFMDILTPEQLWFAEKNERGRTEIFCAAQFQDLKDLHRHSLEKLYRVGRFGAKPSAL